MGVYESRNAKTVQPGRLAPPPSNDRHAQKLQKRQEKILREFGPLLEHMLDADEKILLAARACSPLSVGEYFTTGWLIYILKRCVLVMTNKRILHIPTTRGYAPRGSVAEIPYGDISEARTGRFLGRTLKLRYRSGKTETFQQFQSAEHRRLRELLPTLAFGNGTSNTGERTSLCPRCKSALARKQSVCSSCGLEFKNRPRATTLSLLAPGGGYFYTRHPILGLIDALVETYLTIFFLIMVVAALMSTGEEAAGTAFAAVFIGIILGLEKLVTVSHALHFVDEFIPLEKDPQRLHAAGVKPAFVPSQ